MNIMLIQHDIDYGCRAQKMHAIHRYMYMHWCVSLKEILNTYLKQTGVRGKKECNLYKLVFKILHENGKKVGLN